MNDRLATTWGEIGELFDGPHATPKRMSDGPYFLNISSLNAGRLDLSQSDHVSEEDFAKWTRRVTPQPLDLLFSYETRLGEAALMPDELKACLGRRMALLRPNRQIVDPRFLLYFYLSPAFQRTLQKHTIHGATVPRILLSTMGSWPIELPSLGEQQAIAEVLGALDDKIAANTKFSETLLELTGARYEESLGASTIACTLDDVSTFHNRRRVPLSAQERDLRIGNIPYYGATGVFGFVDEFLFDEILLLVGEDGSVVNDDGSPVTQYIWGPSWVNNHAHVLTGKSITTELLYFAVRRTNVTSLVTGAVQPKISMGNLKRLELQIPGEDRRNQLEGELSNSMALCRSLSSENRTLAATRDALLPQLTSGKLRVKDAEALVASAV
ncbi:restriction endonuclease subunit S [Sinomonas flava]|uniref:Type I restriction modification DNA specificity domain-containing protein n=1 Tax=Sinomonas flava TaxID=496857 RepID=A0ABN3BKN7_9MICC